MKRLFFRADAAPEVGLGHVRRCAVLAAACRQLGAEIHLLVRRRDVAMEALGDWAGSVIHEIPWECTPKEDAILTQMWCQQEGVKVGVLDHYRVDEECQMELAGSGVRWMQFGNPRHVHPLMGDWVHDASPAAKQEAFVGRQKKGEIVFFLGPKFALVDRSFTEQRARLAQPRAVEVGTVLLMFGGGYDGGGIERALDWLNAVGFRGKRIILTTRLNRSLGVLEARVAEDVRTELHVDNWQPAMLMSNCQLAITAGGTSVYELACLGVPTVIVCTANNQQATAQVWQDQGLGVNLGELQTVTDAVAEEQIGWLIEDIDKRLELAKKSWQTVDGKGADRVAAALLACGEDE